MHPEKVAAAGSWSALSGGPLNLGVGGEAMSLGVLGNDLFVGGSCGSFGSAMDMWNGSSWTTIVNGYEFPAMITYNNNLFVTSWDSPPNVSRFDGSAWHDASSGDGEMGGSAFAEFNGDLYMAGYSDTNNAYYVEKWDGSSWSTVGGAFNNQVGALAAYNGNLYAGGSFTSVGGAGATEIAKWDGSSWSAVGGGLGGGGFYGTKALISYNGSLYAAGYFTQAGSVAVGGVAKWDGNSWSNPGGISFSGTAMVVHNGELYIAGTIPNGGGHGSVEITNGSAWSGSVGDFGNYSYVDALVEYGGDVVAGGHFGSVGGVAANSVASWNGDGGFDSPTPTPTLTPSPTPTPTLTPSPTPTPTLTPSPNPSPSSTPTPSPSPNPSPSSTPNPSPSPLSSPPPLPTPSPSFTPNPSPSPLSSPPPLPSPAPTQTPSPSPKLAACYSISNAGTSNVDGQYLPVGGSSGTLGWTNGKFWIGLASGGSSWVITSGFITGGQEFYVNSSTDPISIWSKGKNGLSPVPTVSTDCTVPTESLTPGPGGVSPIPTISSTVAPVSTRLPSWPGGSIGTSDQLPLPFSAVVLSAIALISTASAAVLTALAAPLLPAGVQGVTDLILIFAGHGPLAIIAWSRKKPKWGVVYDQLTREPIPGAIVRIFDANNNRLLESQLTNNEGFFGFLVPAGTYFISVVKPGFLFPSEFEIESGEYTNNYRGGSFNIKGEEDSRQFVKYNIPIKRSNRPSLDLIAVRIVLSVKKILDLVRVPILIIGTILAVNTIWHFPGTLSYIISVVYVLLWVNEIRLRFMGRAYGVALDEEGHPLGRVLVRALNSSGRLVGTTISGEDGKFILHLNSGKYSFSAQRIGYIDLGSTEINISQPLDLRVVNLRLQKLN
jgi:hypothetical protein